MLNARNFGGSYKGLIGECLFKFAHKYAVLTQLANPLTYFDKRPYVLSTGIKTFLKDNWTKIDAVEVLLNVDMTVKEVNIYEIKSQNYYEENRVLRYTRPSVSFDVDSAFRAAPALGINASLAKVVLLADWDFDIQITPYNTADLIVCERPTYNERKASTKWGTSSRENQVGL